MDRRGQMDHRAQGGEDLDRMDRRAQAEDAELRVQAGEGDQFQIYMAGLSPDLPGDEIRHILLSSLPGMEPFGPRRSRFVGAGRPEYAASDHPGSLIAVFRHADDAHVAMDALRGLRALRPSRAGLKLVYRLQRVGESLDGPGPGPGPAQPARTGRFGSVGAASAGGGVGGDDDLLPPRGGLGLRDGREDVRRPAGVGPAGPGLGGGASPADENWDSWLDSRMRKDAAGEPRDGPPRAQRAAAESAAGQSAGHEGAGRPHSGPEGEGAGFDIGRGAARDQLEEGAEEEAEPDLRPHWLARQGDGEASGAAATSASGASAGWTSLASAVSDGPLGGSMEELFAFRFSEPDVDIGEEGFRRRQGGGGGGGGGHGRASCVGEQGKGGPDQWLRPSQYRTGRDPSLAADDRLVLPPLH